MPYKTYLTEVLGLGGKGSDAKTRQRILASCRVGEELVLRHIPTLHYENAIKVSRKNGIQIGWLSETVAEEIVKIIDRNGKIKAKIVKIDLSQWPFKSCRCLVRIIAYFP